MFSSISSRSPVASASAPPLPPSPVTTETTGTLNLLDRMMIWAMELDCPRFSASMPGKAPGVSIRVTTGILCRSAYSKIRSALR